MWEAVEQSDPKCVVESRANKVILVIIYQDIPENMLLSKAEKKSVEKSMGSN